MSKNIWMRIGIILFGYIRKSITNIGVIFVWDNASKYPIEYPLTNEIIFIGPHSFAKKPTAIKLWRALFVLFILIVHLYNHDTEDQK